MLRVGITLILIFVGFCFSFLWCLARGRARKEIHAPTNNLGSPGAERCLDFGISQLHILLPFVYHPCVTTSHKGQPSGTSGPLASPGLLDPTSRPRQVSVWLTTVKERKPGRWFSQTTMEPEESSVILQDQTQSPSRLPRLRAQVWAFLLLP